MVRCDLHGEGASDPAFQQRPARHTRFLICFDTSSMPKVNLEMATDISSFAMESWLAPFVCGAARVVGLEGSAYGYVSVASIALAYSFGSKPGLAKAE